MSLARDMSGPCAVGDLGAYGNTLHGNREILCPPLSEEYQGRIGKSKDNPMMNGHRKSDSAIVPGKWSNNVRGGTAEATEGRGLTKGNKV